MIPEKLYGREREIEALIAVFDRAVEVGTRAGTPRLSRAFGSSLGTGHDMALWPQLWHTARGNWSWQSLS